MMKTKAKVTTECVKVNCTKICMKEETKTLEDIEPICTTSDSRSREENLNQN